MSEREKEIFTHTLFICQQRGVAAEEFKEQLMCGPAAVIFFMCEYLEVCVCVITSKRPLFV